ncbi:MAG: biotin transporter BioY [Candidatus Krumholzibacteria bacterium]|nr:biotin transporter BioY [Candidatus Krumholzibacteria bacterium]MDH4337845.1 biotin transporter BioY [Candidatus Krumholzibacteria bacterium]MDH5270612.1 biotin transporter BioY [Candidatus Krumholzibacteria bacterium]
MHAQPELSRSAAWTLSGLMTARTRTQCVALGAGLALLFTGLTVVGANIVIPMRPVPITLQTLFVLLAGAAIGRGWGSLSQAFYVGLGALGLPVFAGGAAGPAILAGPTGGYLASFLVAPLVVGAMLRRSSGLAWQIAAFTVGTVVIFAFGVAFLSLTYTHDIRQALMVGLVPFLPGAVFKIAAATSIHRSSQALVRHYRRGRN